MADTDTHQYLRAWRRHRKKTLEKVAEAIGSKVNTISGWETGNRGLKLDDLARLAGVYDVRPADLLQSPESYNTRQSAAGFARIADKLSPDQAAHLLWIAEAMISVGRLPAEERGAPPTQAKGTGPPVRPFQAGGRVKENRVSRAVLRVVPPLPPPCPAADVERHNG
jgi:transcriptional regulator with XRE-family HTH domain